MTKASRRLGRGLEALLGPAIAEPSAGAAVSQIPLSAIRPNPYQPRQVFDEQALDELKRSLETSGLLQPVVVRPAGVGKYELIVGERRCRAAEKLGWRDIGAVVRDVDDRTLLALALVENLQRDALSPIDEALAYKRLIDEFGVSQSEVAKLVGRERSTVANALRLLRLPDAVQDMVHTGSLSTGHARALLQMNEATQLIEIAERVAKDGLSVREVEALVRGKRPPKRRPRYTRQDTPELSQVRRVEDALRRRLRTDVFVATRGKESGRLTINFYSNEDLSRILEIVLGKPFDG